MPAIDTESNSLSDALIALETELRAREERYKHLVEYTSDMVYQVDPHGRITFSNAAARALLRYSESELHGKYYLDFIHPEYRDALHEYYTRQYRNRVRNTYLEFPIITNDGAELWIGQNVQLLLENRTVIGFHALARDLTLQHKLEDDLMLQNKKLEDKLNEAATVQEKVVAAERLAAVTAIVQSIAHHINNPLTAVMLPIQVKLRHELSPEWREELTMWLHQLERIRDAVRKLTNLEDTKTVQFRGNFKMIDLETENQPPVAESDEQ